MIDELVKKAKLECSDIFKKIDENELYFSNLVLDAFRKENMNETHFNMTTGYGYNDTGRDAIERVFARLSAHLDVPAAYQFAQAAFAEKGQLFRQQFGQPHIARSGQRIFHLSAPPSLPSLSSFISRSRSLMNSTNVVTSRKSR